MEAVFSRGCCQFHWQQFQGSNGTLICSIPAEHIRVFHRLPALSPIYCLHTVRVAILSDGNWSFVVIYDWDSYGNHRLSILSWTIWVFYFIFFSLKGVRHILSVIDSQLCLDFISTILASGLFLRASVIESPTGLVNWRCWEAVMANM